MTDSRVLLDTSAWISHFSETDKEQVTKLLQANISVFSSVLTLFEVKRKMLKDKATPEKIDYVIGIITSRSFLIELDAGICLSASDVSATHKLGAIDALLYATAQDNSCTLITFDNDFRNLENVKVLKGVD